MGDLLKEAEPDGAQLLGREDILARVREGLEFLLSMLRLSTPSSSRYLPTKLNLSDISGNMEQGFSCLEEQRESSVINSIPDGCATEPTASSIV